MRQGRRYPFTRDRMKNVKAASRTIRLPMLTADVSNLFRQR